MQKSKAESNKRTITPPPGDFAVFSNANVVAHVFQWKQPDERVVLSMAPGEFALATKDFTSSKHSTLKVVAGSLTLMLGGKEMVVQSGESVGLEVPDLLLLKTDVFTQGVLSNSPEPAGKLTVSPGTTRKGVPPGPPPPAKPDIVFWVGAPPSGTRVEGGD